MKKCRLFTIRKDMKEDLPPDSRRTWWKKALILTLLAVFLVTLASAAQAQTITEIIDATGDGTGNTMEGPNDVAVDSSGNVYLAGRDSDNAFKITPGGVITEIIDATGDGAGKSLWTAPGMSTSRDSVATTPSRLPPAG